MRPDRACKVHPTCTREGIRTLPDGRRCCLYSPDQTPPDLDHNGKVRDPNGKVKGSARKPKTRGVF